MNSFDKEPLFLINCENGLEEIVLEEITFRFIKNEIPDEFKPIITKINGNHRIFINHKYRFWKLLDQMPEMMEKIHLILTKSLTVSAFISCMHSIRLKEILIHKQKEEKDIIDSYRFQEELNYFLDKIDGIDYSNNLRLEEICNVSVKTLNYQLKPRFQKQFNDMLLKKVAERTSLTSEDGKNDSIDTIQNAIALITREKIILGIERESALFGNTTHRSGLALHQTPLSPELSSCLAIAGFKLLARNVQDSIKKIMFIDPFCGYGTILNLIATNIDFLKDWLNYNTSTNTQEIDVKLIGLDTDRVSVDKARENFQKLSEFIPNDLIVEYIQLDVKNMSKFCLKKKTDSIEYLIITQPPYGYTLEIADEDLGIIYEEFLNNIENLQSKHAVTAVFISPRNNIVRKLTKGYQIIANVNKKREKYSIFANKKN